MPLIVIRFPNVRSCERLFGSLGVRLLVGRVRLLAGRFVPAGELPASVFVGIIRF